MRILRAEPLTRTAFAPYGEVIDTDGAAHFPINGGYALRFHDLAQADTAAEGGRTIISIFRAGPRPQPIELRLMERHPLGSQAFMPLQNRDWLVVVAGASPQELRAFRATGRQGVNYRRNTWHHPLLVWDAASEFLVVDREGPGSNLEEVQFSPGESAILEL